MQVAEVSEFPFVATLPKREKSKVAKLWDSFQEAGRIAEERGMFVAPFVVAKLLGVSKQRVHQLIESGRLETVDVCGHRCVLEDSLVEFCKTERKSGVHLDIPTTAGECWQRARRKDS
jgi:excisionase family DNA binding protein